MFHVKHYQIYFPGNIFNYNNYFPTNVSRETSSNYFPGNILNNNYFPATFHVKHIKKEELDYSSLLSSDSTISSSFSTKATVDTIC